MAKRFRGHWESLGDGSPVLCISGFATANWMFRHCLTPLAGRYRFLLPDNRGMGLSPPATGPYDLEALADDLIDLMDDLGETRFDVIGLSMGGFVAQLLASRHAGRVRRMVLMCTSCNDLEFRALFPVFTREQIAAVYRLRREDRVNAALSEMMCPWLFTRYPQAHAYIRQQRLQFEPDAEQVLLQYDAVARFLASPPLDLAAFTMPVLVLSGDRDPVVPLPNAILLAARLPDAELRVIEETDHFFFLEKPAEVAERIGEFFEKKS
ncbi:MAG: alpha/beta hydrolase [Magnetococcales bacterium]|nr:alpha/beta hydrolase [Magnetococcales bacterium]